MTPIDIGRYTERLSDLETELGFPFTLKDVTTSTNDDAIVAAHDDAPHGALFVSETQTKGRGRRGTQWSSKPGSSLTFSLLLRPELDNARVAFLSLATGLAVRAVVARHVTETPLVKWPNDVLVNGRKLAGILVESQVSGAKVSSVVIGVGMNTGSGSVPPELRERATSLFDLGAQDVDRSHLLAEIVNEIGLRVVDLESGNIDALVAELSQFDALAGKSVTVEGKAGTARGIRSDGALLLETDSGIEAVISGTVSI